jgi:zinc protease
MLSKIGYRREATAARVLEALDAEVGRIAGGDVAADELVRAKTKLVAGFWSGVEPPLDLAVELAQAAAFCGRPEEVGRFSDRVEAVTPEDLAGAAAWLSPEARAVVVKEPGA